MKAIHTSVIKIATLTICTPLASFAQEAQFFDCLPDYESIDGVSQTCDRGRNRAIPIEKYIFLDDCNGARIPKSRMTESQSEYKLTQTHQTRTGNSTITQTITISRTDGSFTAESRQVDNRDGEVMGLEKRRGICEISAVPVKF